MHHKWDLYSAEMWSLFLFMVNLTLAVFAQVFQVWSYFPVCNVTAIFFFFLNMKQ